MRGQGNVAPGRHGAIAMRLAVEFAGVLSPAAVAAEVRAAEHDLMGQVPAGSLDELLHRLAGQRLAERAGAMK